MADPNRIAFFGWWRIGDFLQGPEGRELPIKETEFRASGWSNASTPVQRGAGGQFRFTLVSVLKQGDGNYAGETLRAFEGRRLQFLKDMRIAAGFVPGTFGQRKTVIVVEDESRDGTTTTDAEVTGNNVTIGLTNSIGCANGDYVLLINPTAHQYAYEVCHVNAVAPTTVRVDTLEGNWDAGTLIYRILYYVPNTYMQRTPKIEGAVPGSARASKGLEFVFESKEDPIWSLA